MNSHRSNSIYRYMFFSTRYSWAIIGNLFFFPIHLQKNSTIRVSLIRNWKRKKWILDDGYINHFGFSYKSWVGLTQNFSFTPKKQQQQNNIYHRIDTYINTKDWRYQMQKHFFVLAWQNLCSITQNRKMRKSKRESVTNPPSPIMPAKPYGTSIWAREKWINK